LWFIWIMLRSLDWKRSIKRRLTLKVGSERAWKKKILDRPGDPVLSVAPESDAKLGIKLSGCFNEAK
jgi:hypothetical protein